MASKRTTKGSGAEAKSSEQGAEQKNRFFNVYNIIGLVLCVLLLPGFIISTTLLISSMVHSDLPPSCFGYTPLMVESGSMSPVFEKDDLVIIQNTDGDATYNVGDIICFHSGQVYVTHRIKEIRTDENGGVISYITQGDANNAPDQGSVRPDQILGVYKTHWDNMGRVFVFMQSPGGIIVFFALPIVLVVLLFTIDPVLRDVRARRTKKRESGKSKSEIDDKIVDEIVDKIIDSESSDLPDDEEPRL